ncbi:MAG: trigger factor [Burkholderiales bacterium]|nr:trigger factor [Burkholderiales bacterium]
MTTTSGLERRLEVTVPGSRLDQAVHQRLQQLSRTARLKGFRPGKVPFAVVRAQFGAQVQAEAVSELLQETFAEAVSKENLRPAGGPRIEPLQLEPGNDLRYAAIFEVMPEVKVAPLGAIAIERPVCSVSDADVDAMVESLRRQRPVFTPVERAARESDRVTIEYEGRIDGEVFPGGKGDALKVVIGTGQILAELDAALRGMAAGESKSVEARFPEDYGAKSVAGKLAVFQVKVNGVEEQSLPPLDEAFVRGFGVSEGGVAEWRAEVRRSMEREVAEAVRVKVRNQLFDALYRNNPLDLPKALIDEQVGELQAQMLRRAGIQDPSKVPQLPREPYEEPARKRVALGLLMGEIVREQQMKVDRGRVEERLNAVAASYPDADAVRRQYLQSREAMAQIESAALEDQVIDWMLAQVKISDQPADFRELTGFNEQA